MKTTCLYVVMMTKGKDKKDLVRYYDTVRVSAKGQLVLPKEYRDEQHIEAGSLMAALRFGTGLLLLPEMEKFEALCRSIEKVITSHDLTADDFLETLGDTRKELFSETYPGAAKK